MTRIEKIRMAMWMFNQLIDRHPEIYLKLKNEYLRRANEKK